MYSGLIASVRRVIVVAMVLIAGPLSAQEFPDVIGAELIQRGDSWTVSATLSSPYDSAERYADGFRVLDDHLQVLGVRTLWHDHANEQPFTRSLTGLVISEGVRFLWVQGRDQAFGWGGQVVRIRVENSETVIFERGLPEK